MFDIYAAITDRITAQLEQGVIPWRKPWTGSHAGAISHDSGRPYSYINQMLLGKPGEYATWTQIQKEGGKVVKGARARMVVFWKILQREKRDDSGQPIRDENGMPVAEGIPVLKYFNVYHLDDVEGIQPRYAAPDPTRHANPEKSAEAVFAGYRARSHVGFHAARQDQAYYSPSRDLISLPLMEQFPDTQEYYSTLFHEAVHSTGHASRLNRLTTGLESRFGGQDYSKEELVAEIGAAAIVHQLGMETPATFRNSAAYVQSWLRALENDKRLIVSAAARAEKAVALIMG